MKDVDHASASWQQKGRLVLTQAQNKVYGKYTDKDGLTPERRKEIEEVKNKKLYPVIDDLL